MSDGPKVVLSSTAGGILDATYPGQLPRNEQQISNFKHYEGTTCSTKGNELYSIMLLATDQQLFDVQRFCCDPQQFSILTVDPTFSLGDFDVTPTTYRHLMLLSKRTNKPPVMLGPIMIHYKKTFTTYLTSSLLLAWSQRIENYKVCVPLVLMERNL